MKEGTSSCATPCNWRIRDRAGARWNKHRRWRTLWWKMTEMQAQAWAAKHGFEIERIDSLSERSDQHSAAIS